MIEEQKVISSAFGDFGMDVRVGTLFQTPEEAAQTAIDMGAHIIGVSSLAAGHKTLLPELIQILKEKEAEDILVICGGIIPQQDYKYLYDAGWRLFLALALPFPKPPQKNPRCCHR